MPHTINSIKLTTKKQNTIDFLPKKNSINRYIFFTAFECIKTRDLIDLQNKPNIIALLKFYKFCITGYINYDLHKRTVINLVFKDMIHNYKIWRHIRGYPVNGQRTWSNGKSVTKNNTAFKGFRINQVLTAFGKKRKNKAPQLISGEYINKLWLKTWRSEWNQARRFNIKSARRREKKNTIFIDIRSLALCITGGYLRKGKARRFNKAKKRFKNITVGLPLFFTRYIYTKVKNKKFLVDFALMHEQRKMKSKRRVKKKVVVKKKKSKKK